jgi:RimJ/RimL family protein N-acetyltransferase
VILRPAREEDSRLIWTWRNDCLTRAMFVTTDPVPWEDHRQWYGRSLANPDRWILVGEDKDQPVGVLRLDRTCGRVAKISINVRPESRGRGVGREILALGAAFAVRLGLVCLEANIKAENVASIALFRGVGFDCAGSENGLEKYVLHLPVAPGITS